MHKEIADFFVQIELDFNIEKSFKMFKNTICSNRYLLGINQKNLLEAQISHICSKINMPERLFNIFIENISDSNMLLFGFEENETNCIYKIYLEYWDRLKNKIYNEKKITKSELLYLGFKWNAIDNNKSTIAQYNCYPLLSVRSILKRLSHIYNCYEDTTSLEVVKEIIKLAQSKINIKDSFIYLEVEEENNQRKSFDINLYKANLKLEEFYPYLLKIYEHYSILGDDFESLYSQIYDKNLGHISGGIDRQGRDFITIYYAV